MAAAGAKVGVAGVSAAWGCSKAVCSKDGAAGSRAGGTCSKEGAAGSKELKAGAGAAVAGAGAVENSTGSSVGKERKPPPRSLARALAKGS